MRADTSSVASQRQQAWLRAFQLIRDDCVIVAACDSKHAPFLFNAIASMDQRFADRPEIVIYDIGLSRLQRLELRRLSGVTVRDMPPFVPHWRLNWSWKLHALTAEPQRYVLYLDLANFVLLRGLESWFLAIQRHGYLLISNGQRLGDVTPVDYWASYGLDGATMRSQSTFGAGIVGFDRQSAAGQAIRRAHADVVKGLNLGRSAGEKSPNYKPAITRDCICFRADQTVLNLAFRQAFGLQLQVRRPDRYCGRGGPTDHPSQYVWYARRAPASLIFVFRPEASAAGLLQRFNRFCWWYRLAVVRMARQVYLRLRPP